MSNPLRLLLAAFLLVAVTVGCSDSGDGDKDDNGTTSASGAPSAEDLTASLQEGLGLDAEVAACTADALLESDLSVEALQALADGDQDAVPADEAEDVGAVTGTAIQSCR